MTRSGVGSRNMNSVRTSKFLSLVLRHKPETIGIELDASGWVDVEVLLEACKEHGRTISIEQLHAVVDNNDKQRFVIRDGRIRANQGHSLSVTLGLESVEPPDLLFHGTVEKFVESIRENGLKRMDRQHVHLSADEETATSVGRRRGKPIIYKVKALEMYEAGYSFFLSENGVWLTESVPPEFLQSTFDDS